MIHLLFINFSQSNDFKQINEINVNVKVYFAFIDKYNKYKKKGKKLSSSQFVKITEIANYILLIYFIVDSLFFYEDLVKKFKNHLINVAKFIHEFLDIYHIDKGNAYEFVDSTEFRRLSTFQIYKGRIAFHKIIYKIWDLVNFKEFLIDGDSQELKELGPKTEMSNEEFKKLLEIIFAEVEIFPTDNNL